MEAHLHAWLSLLVRWAHVVFGVAWIGASFYFNWLENRLRQLGQPDDIADDLWAVHGGGFYYLRKLSIEPGELPAQLNWFKQAAYASWITGMLLLAMIYYWQATTFMVDPAVSLIPPRLAVVSGLTTLILSWLYYDILCRSPVARNELLLGMLIFAWFALVTWALSQLLNGRAAFIHVGAAAGTIMVANVFHLISPAQKELIRAFADGRKLNSAQAEVALQRSRHNSYFALPVLFIMISSHFPMTHAHALNWLVLLLVSLAAVGIRHYFNLRHRQANSAILWAPVAILVAAMIYLTVPRPQPLGPDQVYIPYTIDMVRGIVEERCQLCHSAMPQFAGITAAPKGIAFDSHEQVLAYAELMYDMTVNTQTMPPNNATHMTNEERQVIASWYAVLQHYLEE